MTDCGEKVKRRELFRSRLQLFISVLRLVNGLTNITSAISLLKFHQLHCLVRVGTGGLQIGAYGCDAQHTTAIGDDLAVHLPGSRMKFGWLEETSAGREV